jgi:hypothetical protein
MGMSKKGRIFREIGKVSVTFGSLTFASFILGTIIKGDYSQLFMLCAGGAIVLFFITIGIIFLTKGD